MKGLRVRDVVASCHEGLASCAKPKTDNFRNLSIAFELLRDGHGEVDGGEKQSDPQAPQSVSFIHQESMSTTLRPIVFSGATERASVAQTNGT